MQFALHQSDGGRPSTDQPQQRAPTRVWSEPHRGPNKLAKEGGKRCDFKRVAISLRGEERRRKGRLDFFSLPMNRWPGGHKRNKIGSKIADDFKKLIELTTSN